ncbi:MAG: glycerol-3-phosphate dehydrogenase/oxidase [Novosphingobium sp.]|nr:glycerol-3-phosphate dehydrogenase/oxidase [Novosphingobium sp.]MBX9644587.1 glycerol-3-phosphate dehydrogenase/oxidase [Novosphingobium sp.]
MSQASHLDLRDRQALLRALESKTFDLLVIGGGITGAGIARDAAMRGLSVALIEARDFASGTSSRSSKMVHGGLRYLAQGDIAVVREAASERKILRRIAPHLARQSWFILPSGSLATTAKLRTALWTFEKLGGVAREEHHKVWKPAELARQEPLMQREGLHAALAYPEYLTDDARLTLANVRSAKAHGAVVANYLAAAGIGGAGPSEVLCRSTLDGTEGECTIRARKVVNAAGPWVDQARRIEDPAAASMLVQSKGIHVVVPHARIPIRHTVVMNTPDKRSIFAVPRGEFTYLGTTDEFYPEAEYWPGVEQRDVDYLFETARRSLDVGALGNQDIVSVWAGLRPLVNQPGKSAREISRKDEIWTGPCGMLSIAGGKLSAYRAMAERVVDQVVSEGGFAARPCATMDEALPGGEAAAGGLTGLDPIARERLARLYGAEATALAADGGDIAAEARRAVLVEGAQRLEDFWVRRSGRAWFDDHSGVEALAPAAAEMAALLDWDAARTASEIENCRSIDRASKSGLGPN